MRKVWWFWGKSSILVHCLGWSTVLEERLAGRQDEGYFPSDLEPYDPQNPVVKVILDGFYHALRLPNTKREEVRLKNISSKHQTSGPMYDWMSRDCKPQLNHIK